MAYEKDSTNFNDLVPNADIQVASKEYIYEDDQEDVWSLREGRIADTRLNQIARTINDDNALALKALLPTEYSDEAFFPGSRGPLLKAPEDLTLQRATALVWASAGSVNVVEDPLDRGANVLSERGKVWSEKWPTNYCAAFYLAAMNGHAHILKILFEGYPELLEARTVWGQTALFLAAQGGNLTAVEDLLARGADPAATDPFKEIALHVACSGGHLQVCQALLRSIIRNGGNYDRATAKAIINAPAAITDFFQEEYHSTFQLKKRQIWEIIYGPRRVRVSCTLKEPVELVDTSSFILTTM
ncbi:hypothetical protein ASPCAL13594 [Aspergillus calidoustus]|uniref:Uncharacterized protein n=1 Tax=Aspergillus calidoustus TaxID=454130 RepID=A0A0U5GF22_ASPCI|nr:hypothetical protein ASPCAL13594 [Aspergillus calidoustus]